MAGRVWVPALLLLGCALASAQSLGGLPSETEMVEMAARNNPYVSQEFGGNVEQGGAGADMPMFAEFDPETTNLQVMNTGMNTIQSMAEPYRDVGMMEGMPNMAGGVDPSMFGVEQEEAEGVAPMQSLPAKTPSKSHVQAGAKKHYRQHGKKNHKHSDKATDTNGSDWMAEAEGLPEFDELGGGENEAALEEMMEAFGDGEGDNIMLAFGEKSGDYEMEGEDEDAGEGDSEMSELSELAELEGEAEALDDAPELARELFGDGGSSSTASLRADGSSRKTRHGHRTHHTGRKRPNPRGPEPLPAHGKKESLGAQIKDIIAEAEAEGSSGEGHVDTKASVKSHARIVKRNSDSIEMGEKTQRHAAEDEQALTTPPTTWDFLDKPKTRPQGRCEICSSIVMQKIHGAPIRCGSYVDRVYKLTCENTVRAMVTWGENVVSWLYTHGCTHEDADGYKVQVFPCPPATVCGWIYGPQTNFCPINPFYSPPWRQLPPLPQAMNPAMMKMGRTHMLYKDKLTLKQRLELIKKMKDKVSKESQDSGSTGSMEMEEIGNGDSGAIKAHHVHQGKEKEGVYETLVSRLLETDEPQR